MPQQDPLPGVFFWAWLRLILGFIQMACAAAGAGVLLTIGVHPVLWVFVGGATGTTVLSRLLYRRQPAPDLATSGSRKE